MKTNRTYKYYGEHTLLMEFTPQTEQEDVLQVIRLRNYLKEKFAHKLQDALHSFSSICLLFKDNFDLLDIQESIEQVIKDGKWRQELLHAAHWDIPICFDEEFSVDLTEHFDGNQNKINAYKKIICNHEFLLGFYGFLPGFCYMAGLPEQMAIPRKAKPNRLTKKGSLAVGGQQLGIYPQDSPGGWSVIGSTPISFFNPNGEEICFAKPGDKISFHAISRDHYDKLKGISELGLLPVKNKNSHAKY